MRNKLPWPDVDTPLDPEPAITPNGLDGGACDGEWVSNVHKAKPVYVRAFFDKLRSDLTVRLLDMTARDRHGRDV